MAELNFGLLTPPGSQSIGNAFVSGMDQGQESRARDLQMQQSVRKGQMDELQFRKAQEAEAKLNQFYAHVADNGGPKDPVAIEDAMIKSGIPNVADAGLTARMSRLKLEQSRQQYVAANAMGTAPAPAVAPATASFGADVAARKAELFGPAQDRTNMMPGAAVAPADVNALPATVAPPPQVRTQLNSLLARIDANLALGTDQGYKTAEALQKQVTDLSKRYTVGHTLMGSEGNVVGTAPATPTEFDRLIAGLPPEEQARMRKERAAKMATHPKGVTVNTGDKTETEYGKKFGGLAAESDDKLLSAARSAPRIAENANETLRLLTLPTITGSGADIRLALAKAYNLLGDTDQQSIVNTENLIKSTGTATLAAIKNSGLGTGQGFTDKDLKFLERVTGGSIALEPQTLKDFARIQHDAAVKIAAMWEARKKNIPKSALEGTGIDKESISIEPIRGQAKSPDVWVRDASGKLVKQ